jgi:hypothetical protein
MAHGKTYRIALAGHEFNVRFRAKDRRAVERAAGDKNLFDCLKGGLIEEHALVLWGGLQHLGGNGNGRSAESPLEVDEILDLIDAHNESGGDFYRDVMRTVTRAVLESGVLGKFPQKMIESACGETKEPASIVPQ